MFDTKAEADFASRESEYQKWLQKRPVCDCCNEHITEEIYFEIDGDILCENCLHDYIDSNFKHFIEEG